MSCLTCQHLERIDHAAGAARCLHGGRLHLNAGWRDGCAFWALKPGEQDDREPPRSFAGLWTAAPKPPER
jgi:hypothetical protein